MTNRLETPSAISRTLARQGGLRADETIVLRLPVIFPCHGPRRDGLWRQG